MVERFHGRIGEVLATTRFRSGEHLHDTIVRYVKRYDLHLPQRALKHSAPITALKRWYRERPDLFHKRSYNQSRLDT